MQTIESDGYIIGMKKISSYMGLSHVTVKKLIDSAGLPACKIGGTWMASRESIKQWAEVNIKKLEKCL
jgi:excisionase family DNA binding protein